jgi:hypothetical protein
MALTAATIAAATACTGAASPSAPTVSQPVSLVQPSPAPGSINLTGRITEAPPTATTGVWDATVTLEDGVDSWQSEKTIGGVGRGIYTIPGLRAGRYRATVSADGFVTVTRDVTIASDTTIDFQLLPATVRKSVTVSDHLSDQDFACGDDAQSRPCHIVALPVHNSGLIDATLTWPAGGPALTLMLLQSGSPVPIATPTSLVDGRGRLVANLEGGAVYEIRVIYASGTGRVSYSLSITYPN